MYSSKGRGHREKKTLIVWYVVRINKCTKINDLLIIIDSLYSKKKRNKERKQEQNI